MFTILGKGQVRLHKRAWERSFLCAYLIFADVLLHLKIQFDKFDLKKKKILKKMFLWKQFFFRNFFFVIFSKKNFWKFFLIFFRQKFFEKKNFPKNFFFRIFFFFRKFFWICSWCVECLIWFRFWMPFQLFHLFHNVHTISQDCDLTFHFISKFKFHAWTQRTKADGSAGSAKTVFHRNFVEFSI